MSILKLTENLENFQWTDYESIGNINNPQTFDDGSGNIVTGQKTFERPNESALVTMQSEFAVQSEPGTRGPYSLSDFMDGTKQGRGFIYPGEAPLGFTMDMESLEGDIVSQIVIDGQISLTPLSYTVSGMNSALDYGDVTEQTLNVIPIAPNAWGDYNVPLLSYSSTWTPEQISGNASNFDAIYDRSGAYIQDYPESPISYFLGFTRGSVQLGSINILSPNFDAFSFTEEIPYVIPQHDSTGPQTDSLGFSNTPISANAHGSIITPLANYVSQYSPDDPFWPNYSEPWTDKIFHEYDDIEGTKTYGNFDSPFSVPFNHLGLNVNPFLNQIEIDILGTKSYINFSGWSIGSVHIGTDDIAGVLGGGVNYYGDLKSLAGRSSIYVDDNGDYRVPTIEATTVPPGITEQYPSNILDFTGEQITHNIPQITLSGPFGDEDYQSILQLTPISADAHGSTTVPLENYVSQYSPDDPFWPNYSEPWPDKIFHELSPEGTKLYDHFGSPFSVPFNHSNLNLNPFLNQITLDIFGNMSYITFEGWKFGSVHIPSDQIDPATIWEDMTFPEADKERKVYQHHFLSQTFIPIEVGTDLFDETGNTKPWQDGSIHIIDGDSPGAPHTFFRTSADMRYDPSVEGTKFYTSFGGIDPEYDPAGTIWEEYNLDSNSTYFNPPFSHLSLDVSPYKNMAIIAGASHTPYWKQGSIHISTDQEEASAVMGGVTQFANLDAFNPLGTPFESIYQDSVDMSYTRPSDFNDISENFQRTFNVQGAYPDNTYAYSIGHQFGYSYLSSYIPNITDTSPFQSTDLFPTLYENAVTDEFTGEFAGTALSAIFYQAQADNPDWPYKGLGLGDNFKLLPQRTEMREPTVYADFKFGRTAPGQQPWWHFGLGRDVGEGQEGFHFTWTEQLPDTYQPYVIKDVGERTIVGRDHIVLASLAAAEDIQRINQWVLSPQGKNWVRNQTFLQDLNPRPETRDFSMLGIQASLLPFVHAQRHSTTFTGEGEDSYGNYFQNYALKGMEFLFLDASTVETWGYGTHDKDGFGKIGADIEDADDGFASKFDDGPTGHHYSRLTRLTNKFIIPGSKPKDAKGWDAFKNYIGGISRFGGTPATPTQYVFSQLGPFNTPLLSGDVPGGGTPIDASYSIIGAKYVDHEAPATLTTKIAEEEVVADQVKILREKSNKLTATQNKILNDSIKEAFSTGKLTGKLQSSDALSSIDAQVKAVSDQLNRKINSEELLDEQIKALMEAHTESLMVEMTIGSYMNVLGSPGKKDKLTTIGEARESEVLGEETTGLGIIRKDKDSKSYKTAATDKVNMIPYGYDNIDPGTGLPIDDFIKFKFYDKYNEKFIVFRAILSGISDSISPEWEGTKYIGRPDQVYVYSGAERAISFTFDVYPNTKQEFPVLMEKLNYLIGLCYPSYTKQNRMVAPFIELTIGDMFVGTPGFLSSLSLDVDDVGTWETDPGLQFPKHITCGCEFTYIGKYLPSTLGKHYELGWLKDEGWNTDNSGTFKGDPKVEGARPARHKSDTHSMDKLFSQLTGAENA